MPLSPKPGIGSMVEVSCFTLWKGRFYVKVSQACTYWSAIADGAVVITSSG